MNFFLIEGRKLILENPCSSETNGLINAKNLQAWPKIASIFEILRLWMCSALAAWGAWCSQSSESVLRVCAVHQDDRFSAKIWSW